MADLTSATPSEAGFAAERSKAFIDAVVAIAITLLILPLMESVTDIVSADGSAADWFQQHQSQLISFVISFVLIALFWMTHHRVYSRVRRITTGLLWITMAWLLSIVWFPVATAMSGQMSADDLLVRVVYIGSMILTSLLLLTQRLYLRAHPSLHDIPADAIRKGIAADVAMALLFGVALLATIVWPVLHYYPLFLLFLVGPMQRIIDRLLTPRGARSHDRSPA